MDQIAFASNVLLTITRARNWESRVVFWISRVLGQGLSLLLAQAYPKRWPCAAVSSRSSCIPGRVRYVGAHQLLVCGPTPSPSFCFAIPCRSCTIVQLTLCLPHLPGIIPHPGELAGTRGSRSRRERVSWAVRSQLLSLAYAPPLPLRPPTDDLPIRGGNIGGANPGQPRGGSWKGCRHRGQSR
eukprot:1188530-Prorocentrum_minimum.AAC.2